MKPLTIDIDKLDDFVILVKTAGFTFVDVQNIGYDTLFVLDEKMHFPMVYTHTCHAGSWRGLLGGVRIFEATLEDK